MSEYPKTIENRYWVWTGAYEYVSGHSFNTPAKEKEVGISWEFQRAFRFEEEAHAFAQRAAEHHQVVQITKRPA